jgi:hypothetical protein
VSVRQIDIVLRRICAKLSLTKGQRLLLISLADAADEHGDKAFPGLNRLATETGLSRRWVQIALGQLERLGLIRAVRRGGGRRKRTVYQLHLQASQPQIPDLLKSCGKPVENRSPFASLPADEKAICTVGNGDLSGISTPDQHHLTHSASTVSAERASTDPSSTRPYYKKELPALRAATPLSPVENGAIDGQNPSDLSASAAVRDRQAAAAGDGLLDVRRLVGGHQGPGVSPGFPDALDRGDLHRTGGGRDVLAEGGSVAADYALAGATTATHFRTDGGGSARARSPQTLAGPTLEQLEQLAALKARLRA